MTPLRYFAYGSNMQSQTLRVRRGIQPTSARAAVARGWRLRLDKPGLLIEGEGMANIVVEEGAEVWGVLYEISEDEMAHLDLTEGVLIDNYARAQIVVETLASVAAQETAATFVSVHRKEGLLPSTRYMALLIEGALEHGLPASYVEWLRSLPVQPETEASAAWRPVLDEAMKRR